MEFVQSSNVEAIGYDYGSNLLYIDFHNGGQYVYYDVPVFIYEELLSTPSVGSYLHVYIKNQYKYEKIG